MPISFGGFDCRLAFDRYARNDRIALVLASDDGRPMAVAAVNVPSAPLAPGEVHVSVVVMNCVHRHA